MTEDAPDMWATAIALAGSGKYRNLTELQQAMSADFSGVHFAMLLEKDVHRLSYVRELLYKRNRKR